MDGQSEGQSGPGRRMDAGEKEEEREGGRRRSVDGKMATRMKEWKTGGKKQLSRNGEMDEEIETEPRCPYQHMVQTLAQ